MHEEATNGTDSEKDEDTGKIIAFGSGKGGVGKTVISAALGTGLAMLEKRVILVDADFGSPGLHKLFGINGTFRTYADFHTKAVNSLLDVLIPHPHIDNLQLIIGNNGNLDIANIPFFQRMRFIRQLIDLEADYVLLDLGAGNSYIVLDLFLSADMNIIIVNPDPLSILNGFHFIKNAFYRKLLQIFKTDAATLRLIQEAEGKDHHCVPSVIDSLRNHLKKTDRNACTRLESAISGFKPGLIINQYTESEDEIRGLGVVQAAKKLLNISVSYMGYLHHDKSIDASLNEGKPFLAYHPKSKASRDLMRIIKDELLQDSPRNRVNKSVKKRSEQLHYESVNTAVCAYDCQYWEVCEFKKGGFPCIVRKL